LPVYPKWRQICRCQRAFDRIVKAIGNLLPVNAPCIVFNGSGIYDYQSKNMLYASYLPDNIPYYLKQILLEISGYRRLALNQQKMYCLSACI
jgi:hydroxymethylpyrimidine pyrophosphatase-like HAD family hydrolase